MFYKAVKAQFTFLTNRIDNLSHEFADYKLRNQRFPYSKLYDLHDEINALSQNDAKILLLERLNNEVVSKLLQHNPKLFSYYEMLEEEICNLNMESKASAPEVTLEF
ncbi:hypothetical protein ACD661_04465 [Legionella lytica]|uniref:Coiled-coil protein n=1 Tax=Legionella lytica TaxID=96232 RepID=A0ABW8D532_9GAMM